MRPQNKVKTTQKVVLIRDENQSVAYCHVPKAASTTWMVAFAKMNKLANFTELLDRAALHGELLNNFGVTGDQLDSNATFSFTFIRHPFHRIVSFFISY